MGEQKSGSESLIHFCCFPQDNCVHFDTASDIWLDSLSNGNEFFLDLSLQYKQNVTVTIGIKSPSIGYELKYVQDDEYVKREGNVVSYG